MASLTSAWRHLDRTLRPQGRMFYGWWIVGASGGIQLLAGMLWMQSYGAYMVLLQADFGWSKTLVAGAFALTRIESGILGPFQGWLVDRFGPRSIATIGTLLFGIGFVLFSRIDSVLGFYLTFILIALGSSLGGFATLMVAIVNWFDRHRSKAVAVSQMGYSVGGLSVPLVILSLEAFGWRTTAWVSGILVIVIGVPLCQIVRHRPGPFGESPDGGAVVAADGDGSPVASVGPDMTAREAMRTRAFWLISFGHAIALLTVSSVMVHLIPHLTEDLSYRLAGAGAIVALVTGCQVLGQVAGGYLGDRFNKRIICALCMVSHAAGMAVLAYADSAPLVILFGVLHGLAWGVRGPLMVALRADYFGAASFGTIMGFSSLIVMLGMSGGPIFAGYMADLYGSYQIGFQVIAATAVLGALCFLAATPPARALTI